MDKCTNLGNSDKKLKVGLWEVWMDGEFTGIIVSNYAWESEYWRKREILTGRKYQLKEVVNATDREATW